MVLGHEPSEGYVVIIERGEPGHVPDIGAGDATSMEAITEHLAALYIEKMHATEIGKNVGRSMSRPEGIDSPRRFSSQ